MFEIIRRYRTLFSLIFALAGVGMVVSLFGTGADMGSMGGGGASGAAAKVMGERISVSEFAQAYDFQWKNAQEAMEAQFKSMKADPQTRAFMETLLKAQVNPSAVLNSLVQQRFLIALSKKMGMKVPPEALRYVIAKNPMFQKDGKFDPLLYKQYVARPGDYEKQIKGQLYRDSLFYHFAITGAMVSDAEVSEAQKLKQTLHLELLEVKPGQVKAPEVSDPEIQALLADQAAQAELQSFYESHRSDYEVPTKVRARHILIPEAQGGEKRASEIRAEISAGKITFEEAAKKYSTDKSNSDKGGDLGYFQHESMDPKFSDAAFALSQKEPLSGVIQSSFGFHLIQFVDRKEGEKKSFDEVKQVLARRFLQERAQRNMAQSQLAGLVKRGSVSAADLSKLGAKWQTAVPWTPLDDSLGSVSSTNLDVKELTRLEKPGQLYPRVVAQGQSFYLIRMTKKETGSSKPQDLMAEKAVNMIQTHMEVTMKALEEKKKIYRNEKLLASFQQQVDR